MTPSSLSWTCHPEPSSPPTASWRAFRWLLVALVLCRGLVILCVMPPFEGWDEYQHVGYIEHIRETGHAPVLWETRVPPALLAEALKFPQPACAIKDQLGALGGVGYETYWRNPDAAGYRGGANNLYQAQHSTLAYRLAAPLFTALGGIHNLRASVAGVRLANLGITGAAVWVVLGLLRKFVIRESNAALLGIALAVHPMFLMNGARVANDALGILLATLAVAVCLGLILSDGRRLILHALGAGALIGLAVTAKATNVGLLPVAGLAWLAAIVRHRPSVSRAFIAGMALAVGSLAFVQADLRFNLAHYGSLTSMQEAVINHHKGITRSDFMRTAATIPWTKALPQLWDRDLFFTGGWSFLPTYPLALRYYRYAIYIGLLGWVWHAALRLIRVRSRNDRMFTSAWVPAAFVVIVLGYTAALAVHMVESKAAWGASTTNPWYACAALPWFLAIVSAGGLFWPLGQWGRAIAVGALMAICLGAEFIGIWGRMAPIYAGGATDFEMFRRLAWLQPRILGSATLIAAGAGEVIVLAMLVLVRRDSIATFSSTPLAVVCSLLRRRVPLRIESRIVRPSLLHGRPLSFASTTKPVPEESGGTG